MSGLTEDQQMGASLLLGFALGLIIGILLAALVGVVW